jgi:hypothetical protein
VRSDLPPTPATTLFSFLESFSRPSRRPQAVYGPFGTFSGIVNAHGPAFREHQTYGLEDIMGTIWADIPVVNVRSRL